MVFVKGQSGNPAGKPKGTLSVVSALKKELLKCPQGEKKTYLDLLVKRVLRKGIVEGDVGMIKDIINRVDGLPRETKDLNIKSVEPLLNILEDEISNNDSHKEDKETKKED